MRFTSTASVCVLVSAAQHLAGFAAASPVAQFRSEDLPPVAQPESPDANGAPFPTPSLSQLDMPDASGAPVPASPLPTLNIPGASDNPLSPPQDYPSYISLPHHGDEKALPQPPAGMTLKAVAIGSGEQQYMCKRHKPVPYGAMAELYDAYDMFAYAVNPKEFTNSLLDYRGTLPMKRIGRHYFDARGYPAFDLGDKGFFRGVKTASLDAPKLPNYSRDAIPWLQLKDKGDSKKFKMAYRVATAGGTAPTSCSRNKRLNHIPYAALYYFYG